MNRSTGKKRNKTRIKRVSECLSDHEVEDLYGKLEFCDQIPSILSDADIIKLKEYLNEKIFSLRVDIENDKACAELFENNIIIKHQEIDRLIQRLDSMR